MKSTCVIIEPGILTRIKHKSDFVLWKSQFRQGMPKPVDVISSLHTFSTCLLIF